MNASVTFVAGMLTLLVGVIVRIAGERSTGGAVLLAGAAVLISGRVVGGIRRK